ncbi:unnamed protein product [Lota lota]
MVDWFEKCRQLWIQRGPQRDEALLSLAEDFFDSLMAVHEISKEATYQVTDIFLHPIGQLAAHPIIYILIKKEAIRKFNMVLDKMPDELKKEKKIFSSQEASDVMTKLAGQILDGGDYDFQTALMEALCRMATPAQRREMVHRWFSMDYVAKAFIAIRDAEFETDCRTFLNLVNGMQGDNRRVYSYPCLEAFLDKHELLMPSDEKLEEFWIDFNLGSQSLSFYFALADEEAKWDTICITENEVHSYTIKEEAKSHVLRLRLCEVVCVGEVEGTYLTIRFSPSLNILHAVRTIYGHSKNKEVINQISLDSGGEEPAGLRGKRPPTDSGRPQVEREPAVRCPSSIRAAAVAPPPSKADMPGSANRKRRGQSVPEPEVAKETSAARKAIPAKVLQDLTVNPKVKSAGTLSGKEKGKRYVTKHLFSDTDTDQTKTDVSWLRDSSRRPKPKVTDYTRKAPAKTTARAPDTTYESPDLPLPSPKKDNARPLKKRPRVGEQPERQSAVPTRAAPAAGRRPQRAVATNAKSYREPDTDDSLSETDRPPAAKKPPSVEQQAKRKQASEVAERKKRTSLPYKQTNQKIERQGHDSHTDKELPAPSKNCATGRRGESEKTQSKPSEAKWTPSSFTKQPPKTYQVSDLQSEVGLSPGPTTRERAVQGAGELKRGVTGLRPSEQMSVQKASWNSRLASRAPCPRPMERMRSAATMTPAPAISPLSPLLSPLGSPRPTFPDALHHRGRGDPRDPAPRPPRPVATGNAVSKGGDPASVFDGGPRKRGSAHALPLRFLPSRPHSETPVGRPADQRGLGRGCVTELSPIRRPRPSARPSPLSISSQASQPMLTSTALDADKSPPAPSPPRVQLSTAAGDSQHNHGFRYGSSKESPVSCLTLSLSSVRSSIVISKEEANASTVLETECSLETGERSNDAVIWAPVGPSHRHALSSSNSSSDAEEEEQAVKKKGKRMRQRSPKMKPRKLFKSLLEVSPQGVVVSSTHTLISRAWGAEEDEDPEDQDTELADDGVQDPGHVGAVCRQFSAKLQNKFQSRSRRMERYGRQSAQTAQRHVIDLSAQVNKYRTQRLEVVRQVLHEEITHLEQADSTLKHMEKELTVYWRKQSTAFHSYLEKENRRNQRLKDTLQNSKTYSLEYEGKIFTSQMCLMRKDMKCVQDRLFKEMQEEEIHSVRRGLQALFMPETAMF